MSMIRCCFEPVELPEFVDTMIQKCTGPSCKYIGFSINSILFVLSEKKVSNVHGNDIANLRSKSHNERQLNRSPLAANFI